MLDTNGNNDRGNRAPLNDHLTMYLLMIMHWGAMSMATLLLPDAHQQLYGAVISTRAKEPLIRFAADQLWLREFIQQRVSGSWLYMQMRMQATGADVGQLLAETLTQYHSKYWGDATLRCVHACVMDLCGSAPPGCADTSLDNHGTRPCMWQEHVQAYLRITAGPSGIRDGCAAALLRAVPLPRRSASVAGQA